MERPDEILEIVREIREDIAYMKRHRNMRRLMFSAAEINRFVERIDTECRQRKELKNRIRNL